VPPDRGDDSFQTGLDYKPKQAKVYAASFPSCEIVVVSNGYCYKSYCRRRSSREFATEPDAYLNVLQPKRQYPLDPANVQGGLELLRHLMPD